MNIPEISGIIGITRARNHDKLKAKVIAIIKRAVAGKIGLSKFLKSSILFINHSPL
nr:hypothetical protein BAR15_180266 [Bartonella sp. AR 15-3]